MHRAEAFAIDFARTESVTQHLLSLSAKLLAVCAYQTLIAMIPVILERHFVELFVSQMLLAVLTSVKF